MIYVLCFDLVPKADEVIPKAEDRERVDVSLRAAQAEQVRKNIFLAPHAKHLARCSRFEAQQRRFGVVVYRDGAPEEIRTPDPQIRSLIFSNSLTFLDFP